MNNPDDLLDNDDWAPGDRRRARQARARAEQQMATIAPVELDKFAVYCIAGEHGLHADQHPEEFQAIVEARMHPCLRDRFVAALHRL